MGRKASPAITTSTGPLYLIPLKVCNEKAETGTVCGFCFGFFQLINIKFMLYLYRNMSMIRVT